MADQQTTNFGAILDKKLKDLKRKIKKPNVLITGITGVGKTSLGCSVFGRDIAKTGVGRPVTDSLTRYEDPAVPIVLYDTIGYEVDTDINPSVRNEIFNFISSEGKGDAGNRIHLAWYVIDASRGRIQSIDIDMCQRLRDTNIPFAIVLSKCDLASSDDLTTLKKVINKTITNAEIFCISNIDIPDKGHLELEQLGEWSSSKLPDAVQLAFIKAQRISLSLKRKKALAIVAAAVAGNFGIGFSPIPFSDAPLLLAVQGAMLSGVLYIYETPEMIKLKNMMVTGVTSMLGVTVAGSILKLFPGIGTIAGGIINGSVASVFTTTIGLSSISICHKYYTELLLNGESELNSFIDNNADKFESIKKSVYNKLKNNKFNYKKVLKEEGAK